MTQVLLLAAVTRDGIAYPSDVVVDFAAADAASLVTAGSATASLSQINRGRDGRGVPSYVHAARLATLSASLAGSLPKIVGDAAYTFGLSDLIAPPTIFTTGATVTVPPSSLDAMPLGTTFNAVQNGSSAVTIAGGAGVTINRKSGAAATSGGQYTLFALTKTGPDTWTLYGALG